MNTDQKIKTLQRVLTQVNTIEDKTTEDAEFITWQNATKLALSKVFGDESHEYRAFTSLPFYVMTFGHGKDHAQQESRRAYSRDIQITTLGLEQYICDLQDEMSNTTTIAKIPSVTGTRKVFISHASANKDIVVELIEMLKQMGLRHGQIFCTSFPEYSIPLGVNYLDWLKKELTDNSLVLFVLSHEFYQSPVCLSEMGATWALSKEHVPIIVPPFTYDDTKGPFPQSQGMIVTEKFKYNELASIVERLFDLPARGGDWERSRDTIITRIENRIQAVTKAEKPNKMGAIQLAELIIKSGFM